MPDDAQPVLTERLRLEPISRANADDLHLVHTDPRVVPWYDGWNPSLPQAIERAEAIAESWRHHGVHKWVAYERSTGEVVGRGGLSRTPVDEDWGQLYRFLPDETWVRERHPTELPFRAHAWWMETGWALRGAHWGLGYASELGRASLAFAFDELGMRAVVSCTARHNLRSLAVMERIGMRRVGEIRSPGIPEGELELREDAPFAVSVLLNPSA